MKTDDDKKDTHNLARQGRRKFLRVLGASTVGVATVGSLAGAVIPDTAAPEAKDVDKASDRYRESDHVKAFYATLRD
ncbi:formate dehydrogenase [Cobetia sp. L2A1]|uniref:formate dehydrogenase n=1 Tax=Cobetia sp. L2A1 TaxID=2686360 RepID=UPI00131BF714|nr:formate dehydrogenase [Cobetia sp. L2A1]